VRDQQKRKGVSMRTNQTAEEPHQIKSPVIGTRLHSKHDGEELREERSGHLRSLPHPPEPGF